MKKITQIGLLVLLLCNTFGLSLAVFLFEKEYQVATPVTPQDDWKVVKMYLPSLPYSNDLEIPQHIEALVRLEGDFYNPVSLTQENDTLYVTLKSNQAARDHFFELANAVQVLSDQQNELPGRPFAKMIELLSGLATNYLPNQNSFRFEGHLIDIEATTNIDFAFLTGYTSVKSSQSTPPPEFC